MILYAISNNKKLIKTDVNSFICHTHEAGGGALLLALSDSYFRKLFYYRLGRISKFLSWYTPGAKTFIIGCKSIGEGPYFPHSYATIINAKSIGANFACRQCTTIGNKVDGRNDLVPTIGNNVTLGANVCIIGKITIGDNVVIGAGSVVVHSLPDNCVAAGNPARIISKI